MSYGTVLLRSDGRRVAGEEGRRIRLAAQLSLRDVAEVVGVTHTAIAHWESGSRKPRGEAADRYGVLIDYLRKRCGEATAAADPPKWRRPPERAKKASPRS